MFVSFCDTGQGRDVSSIGDVDHDIGHSCRPVQVRDRAD
jgi:hypothetical protein